MRQGHARPETVASFLEFILDCDLFLLADRPPRRGRKHAKHVGDIDIEIDRHLLQFVRRHPRTHRLRVPRKRPRLVHLAMDALQDEKAAQQNDDEDRVIDLWMRVRGNRPRDQVEVERSAQQQCCERQRDIKVIDTQTF